MAKQKEIRVYGIDPELHKKFKSACDYAGTTMNDNLIGHMRNTIANHIAELLSQEKVKQSLKKGSEKP